MKLDPKALALTAGILCGLYALLFMLVSLWTGYGKAWLMQWGPLHPGFSYTYGGAVWMGIFHLIVGAIGGWIFAWVYNQFAKK